MRKVQIKATVRLRYTGVLIMCAVQSFRIMSDSLWPHGSSAGMGFQAGTGWVAACPPQALIYYSNITATIKNSLAVSSKFKLHLQYDSTIIPGYLLKKIKTCVHKGLVYRCSWPLYSWWSKMENNPNVHQQINNCSTPSIKQITLRSYKMNQDADVPGNMNESENMIISKSQTKPVHINDSIFMKILTGKNSSLSKQKQTVSSNASGLAELTAKHEKMFGVMKEFYILIMVVVVTWVFAFVKCHQNVDVKWLCFTVCKLYLQSKKVSNRFSRLE